MVLVSKQRTCNLHANVLAKTGTLVSCKTRGTATLSTSSDLLIQLVTGVTNLHNIALYFCASMFVQVCLHPSQKWCCSCLI